MLWEVDRGLGLFKLRVNQRFPIKAFPLSFSTPPIITKNLPLPSNRQRLPEWPSRFEPARVFTENFSTNHRMDQRGRLDGSRLAWRIWFP